MAPSGWRGRERRGPHLAGFGKRLTPPSNQGPAAHLLIDSLAEDGQEEDGGNGRTQVTGDGLDVVKELPALRRLDHGHPGDADANQAQDEQPGRRRRQRGALGDAALRQPSQ